MIEPVDNHDVGDLVVESVMANGERLTTLLPPRSMLTALPRMSVPLLSVITDPRLVAAVVDRITLRAHIIETGTDSFRLRATRRAKGT